MKESLSRDFCASKRCDWPNTSMCGVTESLRSEGVSGYLQNNVLLRAGPASIRLLCMSPGLAAPQPPGACGLGLFLAREHLCSHCSDLCTKPRVRPRVPPGASLSSLQPL